MTEFSLNLRLCTKIGYLDSNSMSVWHFPFVLLFAGNGNTFFSSSFFFVKAFSTNEKLFGEDCRDLSNFIS